VASGTGTESLLRRCSCPTHLAVSCQSAASTQEQKQERKKRLALDSLTAISLRHEKADNNIEEMNCWDFNKNMIGSFAQNGIDIGRAGYQKCLDDAHASNHHFWIEVFYKSWVEQIEKGNIAGEQWANSAL
jgi:hypothetical protein